MEKSSKKDGVFNFVQSMLESAKDNKEVKPQTRCDNVDLADVEKIMAKLKKGSLK